LSDFLYYSGITAWGLAMGCIGLWLILGKDWKSRLGILFIVGPSLKSAINNILDQYENHTITKASLSELITAVIKRLTRVGLITFIIASFPTILLFQQNRLIQGQNSLLDRQNSLTTTQNHLSESERRSSLVFLMSSVLDRLDEELSLNKDGNLSSGLKRRIIALSHGFRPYFTLEEGKLSSRLQSPERGHLFTTITMTGICNEDMKEILQTSDFSYAVVGAIDLSKQYLYEVNLMGADLRKANFNGSNLEGANLDKTLLNDAQFNYANLARASLVSCDAIGTSFSDADLTRAILRKASLVYSSLSSAKLVDANLSNANLSHTNLWAADLTRARLDHLKLEGASFYGTNIEGVFDHYLPTTKGGTQWINETDKIVRYTDLVTSFSNAQRFQEIIGVPDSVKAILQQQAPCLFQHFGCSNQLWSKQIDSILFKVPLERKN